MTRSTVVCSDVLNFTTLRNRLAKYLQPSIWQTLEADKRRQEQRARPTNETVWIVDSAAIGASALHVVLAILIGPLDRQERQAIATVY